MLERCTFSRDKLSYKWPDWKVVHWSDEIHFGLGPEKMLLDAPASASATTVYRNAESLRSKLKRLGGHWVEF